MSYMGIAEQLDTHTELMRYLEQDIEAMMSSDTDDDSIRLQIAEQKQNLLPNPTYPCTLLQR
jgi:hypothetical protein